MGDRAVYPSRFALWGRGGGSGSQGYPKRTLTGAASPDSLVGGLECDAAVRVRRRGVERAPDVPASGTWRARGVVWAWRGYFVWHGVGKGWCGCGVVWAWCGCMAWRGRGVVWYGVRNVGVV